MLKILSVAVVMAMALFAGDGRVKNIDEAIEWYLAKHKIEVNMKLNLKGECAPGMKPSGFVSDEQSYKCYIKKARAGGYEEQVATCKMYIYAIGTAKNLKKAKYWCKKGIERGHPEAAKLWYNFELWKY